MRSPLTHLRAACPEGDCTLGGGGADGVRFLGRQGPELEIQNDDDLKKLALKMANVRPDQRMYGK